MVAFLVEPCLFGDPWAYAVEQRNHRLWLGRRGDGGFRPSLDREGPRTGVARGHDGVRSIECDVSLVVIPDPKIRLEQLIGLGWVHCVIVYQVVHAARHAAAGHATGVGN